MNLFKVIRSFSTLKLHTYLSNNLKVKNLLPLKSLQLQTLEQSLKEKHIFINEIDGSGKTLAYLIPIVNEAIIRKTQKREASKAIIVTLNKQLAVQIYQQIRSLDPKNMLNITRSGSITHYSPVVDEMCKPSKQQDHDLIVDLMNKNVAESVKWSKTDILITTPKVFYRILSDKEDEKELINPQYVVLDEVDVIINNSDLLSYTNQGLQYIHYSAGKSNSSTKYILVTQNHKGLALLGQGQISLPKLEQFALVSTQNNQNSLRDLRVSFIKIKNQYKQEIKSQKLNQLSKIIANPQRKRVIVYCDKGNIQAIKSVIVQKTNNTPSQMYASLSTQKRMLSLFNFIEGRSNVLITTDVTSRGFNFGKEVDTIVSYDMGKMEEEISRITRSNKRNGQYIIFAEQEQKNQLQQLMSNLKTLKIGSNGRESHEQDSAKIK